MKTRLPLFGLIAVIIVFLLQMVIYSRYQPQIRYANGRGDDGIYYGHMADQIVAGEPITGSAPFVYRIGGSWMAAKYSQLRRIPVDRAFQEVNFIMMFATTVIMYLIAIRFSGPVFAVLATMLFSLPWWSYARLIFFYPVLNDMPFLLPMMVALVIILWWPSDTISVWRVLTLSALCLLTPIIKETGLLIPLIWIGSRVWFRHHLSIEVLFGDSINQRMPKAGVLRMEVLLAILFLCLSVSGIMITRFSAHNLAEYTIGGKEYTVYNAVKESIKMNSLWNLVLSFCLAYGGPLVSLFIVYHRYWREKLQYTPALILYWIGVIVLAFLGGVSTLRFMSLASPVAFIFIAHLAHKFWIAPSVTPWRLAARSLLLVNLAYYLVMIHPFDSFFDDYYAWLNWGGLQFSNFSSVKYLIPCVVLFLGTVLVGRKIVPDARGIAEQGNPPYPEPGSTRGNR